MEPGIPLRTRSRAMMAATLGIACAVYVIVYGRAKPDFVSDFDQVWAGARALWHGQDPYAVVGPGRAFPWKWPLYYPMPALVAVAPLGLLPVLAARAVFSGASAALLAWAITRDGWQRLPILLSVSFLVNAQLSQWSALLTAAFFLPAVGFLGITKPNFGVVVAAGARTARSWAWLAGGAAALLTASLLVQADWYVSWIRNVRAAEHFRPPVLRPLGFLLLLAALKWRRPEARWLLALACVPQAPSFYDQLLLGVVCLTTRESLLFAVSTAVLFVYVGFNVPQPDYAAWGMLVGNATVWICYFPALAMVLRRPNEGALPRIRIPFVTRPATGTSA